LFCLQEGSTRFLRLHLVRANRYYHLQNLTFTPQLKMCQAVSIESSPDALRAGIGTNQ
jgi:hypothetical protein